jgi:hypothetical protein
MSSPSLWRRSLHSAVAPVLVALLAVGACALQSAIYGVPVPTVHDEFSYLLAADTFAHGRLTNATPPLWEHFETLHTILHPTYASKYPPGQGLFLAAGKLLGHPAFGVWLGVGLACGAGAWMLRAFVPRWWAVAGGLILVARLGLGKWGWNYWGGAVAFAGGALFIGGWVRVMRKPRTAPAAAMALGLVVLANSRPYEGLLLCIPVGLATLWRFARGATPPLGTVLRKTLLPVSLILLPAALAMGYYNYRVTGNALRLPYMEYSAQYDVAPPLLFLKANPPPTFNNNEQRDYQLQYQYAFYEGQRTSLSIWWTCVLHKLEDWRAFFFGYALLVPLVVLPCVWLGSPRTRFAALAAGFVLGMVATTQLFGMAHYVAPAAPLLYVLVVQCFRYISLFRRRLAAVWLAVCMLAPVPSLFPQFQERFPEPAESDSAPSWLQTQLHDWLVHPRHADSAVNRMKYEKMLRDRRGRHLVLVEYDPDHSIHDEWVRNEADIEGAAVIWARPLNPEGAERLMRQFPDRAVWYVYVTAHSSQIRSVPRGRPGQR